MVTNKGRYNLARRKRSGSRSKGLSTKLQIAGLLIVFLGLLSYTLLRDQPGEVFADLGNEHISPPATATYNTTPPTSGPHYQSLARWGVHDQPIADEVQVHNLEDGGVMVQYTCDDTDDCDVLVAQLSQVVERYGSHVILAPYPEMPTRIALTAWTVLDAFDAFDEDRIVDFIDAYRGLDHHVDS